MWNINFIIVMLAFVSGLHAMESQELLDEQFAVLAVSEKKSESLCGNNKAETVLTEKIDCAISKQICNDEQMALALSQDEELSAMRYYAERLKYDLENEKDFNMHIASALNARRLPEKHREEFIIRARKIKSTPSCCTTNEPYDGQLVCYRWHVKKNGSDQVYSSKIQYPNYVDYTLQTLDKYGFDHLSIKLKNEQIYIIVPTEDNERFLLCFPFISLRELEPSL